MGDLDPRYLWSLKRYLSTWSLNEVLVLSLEVLETGLPKRMVTPLLLTVQRREEKNHGLDSGNRLFFLEENLTSTRLGSSV